MDFIVGLLGGEVAKQAEGGGATGSTGDMAKNPASQGAQAQTSAGAGSFQQLMQQVMAANSQMPNLAQQAMQQAQQQTRPGGWGQLLM